MIIDLNGIKLHYEKSGAGRPLLLLHGWGGSIASFAAVQQHLEKDFCVYNLDLPGFGESPPPSRAWGTEEYTACLQDFLAAQQIKRPILIGHSFGGRLSIRLGALGIPAKIVLVDAAGLPPKRPLSYYLKVYSYKAAKLVFRLPGLSHWREQVLDWFRGRSGSSDYREASGVMRQTFVRVVNEDLGPLLPRISAPTLLIWGDRDTATPLSDGKKMEQLIPDAGLVVFAGAGHFSYLEQLPRFLRVLDSFLAPDKEGKYAR